jgi:hypothetical protein
MPSTHKPAAGVHFFCHYRMLLLFPLSPAVVSRFRPLLGRIELPAEYPWLRILRARAILETGLQAQSRNCSLQPAGMHLKRL